MFTQTHLLLNACLLTRKGMRRRNVAVVAGALFPDTDVALMFIVERVRNTPGCEIFHFRYLEEPWTSVQMVVNSFPLYLSIAAIGMLLVRMGTGSDQDQRAHWNADRMSWAADLGMLMAVFSTSALIHISIDFLLHHEDARNQFWPLANWVFRSPVSYWDPKNFGHRFVKFEILLGVMLSTIIWRRYRKRSIQAIIAVLCLGYAAPIYASLFGAADHDRGPGSCESRKIIISAIFEMDAPNIRSNTVEYRS
jgi:hypothetical protein